MESFNKMRAIDASTFEPSSVFIAVDSVSFRNPAKISVENLLKQVNDTMKRIENDLLNVKTPSVHSNDFSDQNISYYLPPLDLSTLSGMHMVTDGNYLYIWVGNRWKRTPLSEW